MLGGVCGGVATYLNLDPTLVRILTVVLTFVAGFPAVVYLIALLVMPEEGSRPRPPYPPVMPRQSAPPPGQPYAASDPVWGPAGAPWEQPQPEPLPHPAPPTAPGHSPGNSTEPGDSRDPR